MSIELQAYNLRIGQETCRAILIAWLNAHTGVFTLCGKLGQFTELDTIKVNMHTLEATRYVSLVKEAM